MTEEKKLITEQEMADALNGNFLQRMKEFAWRGKNEKLPDIPNADLHSFSILLGFNFAANPDDPSDLTFSTINNYRLQFIPFTHEDIAKAKNESSESERT